MQLEPNALCKLIECKVRIEAVENYVRNNSYVTTREILAFLGIEEKERKEEE